MFNIELGLKKDDKLDLIKRVAVKAIIIKNDKIMMIRTKNGDLKFPGGGSKSGEDINTTLRRELIEETGCFLDQVKEEVGVIYDLKVDKFNNNKYFEMISHYYLCSITDEKTNKNLDDYEKELEFKTVWVGIDNAISTNKIALTFENHSEWVKRELLVLEEIKNIMK